MSCDRFDTAECSPQRKLLRMFSSEYHKKQRLCIQNRSGGCVLPHTNPFRQQKVSDSFASLHSKHSPKVFTRQGHIVAGYLHHHGISVLPYLDDWLVHQPDRKVLLYQHSQLLVTQRMVGFKLNVAKSEQVPVQDIQFPSIRLCLDLGRALLPESKAREVVVCAYNLSSQSILSF